MELIEREAAIKALQEHGLATGVGIYLLEHLPAIDPIKAAGGCRCRECRFKDTFDCPVSKNGYTFHRMEHCSWGEQREAQDDE